jgi:hypothetical protein
LADDSHSTSGNSALTDALNKAFEDGRRQGHGEGYGFGYTDGYRAAKGGSKSTRITAKRVIGLMFPEIGWRARDIDVVRAGGETLKYWAIGRADRTGEEIPAAVIKFSEAPTHKARLFAWPESWPRPLTLVSEYHRQRAKYLKEQQNKSANS